MRVMRDMRADAVWGTIDFPAILDNMRDGVYCADLSRKITYWNPAAEGITGFAATEVTGSHCGDNLLMHLDGEGNVLCRGCCPMAATIADGQAREAEVYVHHKEGHRIPVWVRVTPMRDRQGVIVGAMELFADLGQRSLTAGRLRELEELALLDPLTRLSNRRHLDAELRARFEEQRRYGLACGAIFMDIDDFKGINDRYGHLAGDLALKTVAGTLAASARPFDVFGRWGGDEFLGILRNVDAVLLGRIAERMRMLVAETHVHASTGEFQVTASAGAVALHPGDTIESLLERADVLMRASKVGGKNRVSREALPRAG
jgi:diguanylate cyclase (GGDEF)-like protein/PAS domain S-box-containing protein